LLGAIAASGALAFVGPHRLVAAEPQPIQLGLLVPLTEQGGPDGSSIMAAQQAVLDEVNAAGGVLGRRIALAVADDLSDLKATVRAVRQLIDTDKVEVIMGIWASADAAARLRLACPRLAAPSIAITSLASSSILPARSTRASMARAPSAPRLIRADFTDATMRREPPRNARRRDRRCAPARRRNRFAGR